MQYNLIEYTKQDLEIDAQKSMFAPYQLSIKLTVFPMSDKYRFLVNHSTGSGKTISSLLAAKNFIDYGLPVFIITFNQTQFLKELSTVADLGFITKNEAQLMKKKEKNQQEQEDVDRIQKQFNKRIRNKITFIGYRELFINIFGSGQQINRQMIDRFKGSLIICDEIHNIYNHTDKNIYGVSIQFLSYILGDLVHMLFLSATPLSYSGELSSLLSIMSINKVQQQKVNEIFQMIENQNQFKSELIEADQTSQDKIIESKVELISKLIDSLTQSIKLTPQNASSYISEIMKHKISFVPEIQKDFPISDQKGVIYKAIPNIYIQKCQISDWFKKIMISSNYFTGDESSKSIIIHPTENFYQVVLKLQRQDKEIVNWAKENNIILVDSMINQTLSGSFLKAQNIGNYSPKLGFLINQLLTTNTKSFIYINKLKGFGVDIIVELLKQNGIVFGDKSPTNMSICFQCKQQQNKHGTDHQFVTYRAAVLTGANIVAGEKYLKEFNSIQNIHIPKYHIFIGNIKMKEGYDVLAVNNMYIMTLPYNITNLIQVLGRCIRNKSHIELPKQQQYVNSYLLVNSCDQSEQLESSAFQDIKQHQDKSRYFGQITREEIDVWDKNQDFQIVQHYESLIHAQSIDVQYFHPMYLNSSRTDNVVKVQSSNLLKMTPFEFEIEKKQNKFDIDQNLNDFYLLNISQIINNSIKNRLQQLLQQQNIWQINDLVNAVLKFPVTPNLSFIPVDIIIQKIYTYPNIYIINDFVIYSIQVPELDFFLSQTENTPAIIVKSQTKQNIDINQEVLVQLYEYIKQISPQYIQNITLRKIPTQQSTIKLQPEQLNYILNSITRIFGKSQIQDIQELYKKYIIRYNDQGLKKQKQQDQTSVIFLSVINFIYPFTYMRQTEIQKTKQENQTNGVYSQDILIINGYLLDLNQQIYINSSGEQSVIIPKRESVFSNQMLVYNIVKKEFKITQISISKNNFAKYSGNSCLNTNLKELEAMKQITRGNSNKQVTKQFLCQQILIDFLKIHFENILAFKQFYNILFESKGQ